MPADKPVGRLELLPQPDIEDRKSTRLNSSHLVISYAGFCLKKKDAWPRSTCIVPGHPACGPLVPFAPARLPHLVVPTRNRHINTAASLRPPNSGSAGGALRY